MVKKKDSEERKKCAASGKALRKSKCYYRDGKFYYSKNYWLDAKKKAAEAAAESQPSESPQ